MNAGPERLDEWKPDEAIRIYGDAPLRFVYGRSPLDLSRDLPPLEPGNITWVRDERPSLRLLGFAACALSGAAVGLLVGWLL